VYSVSLYQKTPNGVEHRKGVEEKRRKQEEWLTLEGRGHNGGDGGLVDDSALGFDEERSALLRHLHKAEDVDIEECLGDSDVRVEQRLLVS
jgi:NAD(P)H-hydrate repair Nnr-like enzyme with NAD(P)H-hydrate epimerase domain